MTLSPKEEQEIRAELARRELLRRKEQPEDNENLLQKVARYGLKDPLAGVLEMGKQLGNIPHKLLPFLPAQPNYNWSKEVGVENPNIIDKLIQNTAQYAPSLAIPGANIGRVAGALSKIAPKAGSMVAEGISQAIPQAAFGATQTENPLQGAAEGAVGGFAAPYLAKAFEAMRPSNVLKGSLTPDELRRNLEITRGTETSLGQVLENPSMMRLFENVLPHVIGSGAEKSMLRNAEVIRDKMKFPPAPDNYGETIRNALTNAEAETQAAKRANFDVVNDLAERHGVTTSRNNMTNEARRILEESQSDPHLAHLMSNEDRTLLRHLANPEHEGEYTLRNTDILKGKIGELAAEAAANGQQPKLRIYRQLRNALSRDVDEAIENSGSAELRNAHKHAMQHYRNEVVPFEDPDIVKFTRKGGDTDLILSHFLKGGQNDRANVLRKLLTKLKPNERNVVRSAYFSKALDEGGMVNPIKFKSLYNKLAKNPNQLHALYPEPELRTMLKDYADLVHKNAESYGLMYNPKTGARNTEGLIKGLGVKAGQLTGVGLAHSLLMPLVLGATLGKGATKLLTSEKVRENIVNKMIANQNMIGSKGVKKLGLAGHVGATEDKETHKPMILELIKSIDQI